MESELLYSWSIEDTRKVLNKYDIKLPDWMEYVAGALGLGGLLYIIHMYIFPMGNIWLVLVIGAPTLLLILFTTILGIKPKGVYGDGWYLDIYSDKIKVNIDDINGNYDMNNIDVKTIKIKYILNPGGGGFGLVKGLCFKTISPHANVKVSLVILLPRHTKELNNTLQALTQRSVITV